MWGIPMAIWIVMFALFVVGRRRSRWERWARMDRRYVGPGPWGHAGQWGPPRGEELSSPDRDAYVEQLETRVARLEERLDFTEKLLSERRPERVES